MPQRPEEYGKYGTVNRGVQHGGYRWKYATLARHLDNGVPLAVAKAWAHLTDVPDMECLQLSAKYRGRIRGMD